MREYPGKYVIGLTGNIGTGKSQVRKMLEGFGAFTIDTDSLGHRVLLKEGVGYQACVREFGQKILDGDGNIVRSKLASIVFTDPKALTKLERIVQPAVFNAVDYLVINSKARVIVIESISILNSELRQKCDSIWVVESNREIQTARLMKDRGLDQITALMRINAQSDQQKLINQADFVIQNNGTISELQHQVREKWNQLPVEVKPQLTPGLCIGDYILRPAYLRDIEQLKRLLEKENINQDIHDWVYTHQMVLILHQEKVLGLILWEFENLLFIVTDYISDHQLLDPVIWKNLVKYLEFIAIKLQSEAIVFLISIDQKIDYKKIAVEKISMPLWRDIAIKLTQPTSSVLYKQFSENFLLINPLKRKQDHLD